MLLLTKTYWTMGDTLKALCVSLIVTMVTGEMVVAVVIVPPLGGVQIDPLVDSVSYLLILLLGLFLLDIFAFSFRMNFGSNYGNFSTTGEAIEFSLNRLYSVDSTE